MHARGALATIFTGYPRFKLREEGLPDRLIRPFPYVHSTFMALSRLPWARSRISNSWEHFDFETFDDYVSSRLPVCDIFVGQSGSSLQSGKVARGRGIRYVCDRGPAHIRAQDQLLREEYERWGIRYQGIDRRVMAREEAEYVEADRITVASSFSLRTFIDRGVAPSKLRRVQYGVNLSQFYPTDIPDPVRFDVLFVGTVSLQKGIPYLLQAFQRVQHPKKSLTFAGSCDHNLISALRRHGLWLEEARVVGHVPKPELKHLISRSHVLVLPSIQDGFGLVLAEAMACGCVVIGTHHTGAPDLVTDGVDGFIVPIRDSEALAARLQWLADDPDRRAAMGQCALKRVELEGGWRNYGDQAMSVYREVLA
jgi:glycosyltransferase involved in cell wall biosynthesis